MAETVKKSRIVSDEDLEQSLMQEFNMRLKTCMSDDNLNDEEAEKQQHEEYLYENVEIIKTNGKTEFNILPETAETPQPEADALSNRNKMNSIEEFIQIEREYLELEENGYRGDDKTKTTIPNGDNHAEENNEHLGVEIYENVPVKQEEVPVETYDDASTISIEEKQCDSEINEPCTDIIDTQIDEATSIPVLEKLEEAPIVIENPDLVLESEAITEIIEPEITFDDMNELQLETKSVRDRMFLSTDSASCLLFTQTVTSPMLTPSEEQIDFMRGFQRDSSQNTLSDTSNASPKSEIIDEIVDTSPAEELLQTVPVVIETLLVTDIDEEPQSVRNVEGLDLLENIHDNDQIMDIQAEINDLEKNVMQENGNNLRNTTRHRENAKQKYIESIRETNKEVAPVKANTECSIPSMQTLKTQYMKTATSENSKPSAGIEKNEFSSLKSLDIMKQISKFEQISPNKEDGSFTSNLNSSTETTESTYTETTTVETKSSGQEKVLKKKKSKKSRSHEKENISVNDISYDNGTIEENFYNVNVKSLCRSFGDLTKICDDKPQSIDKNNKDEIKMKTKSMSDIRTVGTNKIIENVFKGVSVKALKSSFSKFDALQKKNVLHVRSSDSSKAPEKFNGAQIDNTNCKSCGKIVFQMEQMKAEKCIWHKNCFRCQECNKQLTVDTYQSHEGTLYCKPHFRALFAPKVVEDEGPQKPRKHEMIIRENQPLELPPDVVRASDKPDLGLEELQSLNVKERFQVFEHHDDENQLERTPSTVNVKRSPSILSKLARFQSKGMNTGVTDESLNGIPIEESSSDEEIDEEEGDGDDADLIRAKKAQKEKPFHFIGMSDVKSKWEQGDKNGRDERREERKQEIQSIRNRLFMGKQGKMKEAYQQAVMESESGTNVKKTETIEVTDTRSLKERFEKGDAQEYENKQDGEDMTVFESGISKKSRSIFLELDANASKAPQLSPVTPPKPSDAKKSRDVFLARQISEDVVKSTETVEDVTVQTADIQQRFKFFETYKEPEQSRKQFRITPPREGQVKIDSPDREVYRDPEVIRSEEYVEDSGVAKKTQTAKKMLNKFRQMEEDLSKDQVPLGPKPLKRFTPPPGPVRSETESDDEDVSETEEESETDDHVDYGKVQDEDLLEAQKAARAKQLRAKFEKWEANEIHREQNNSSVNIAEEFNTEEQSQIESTKSLRARFESMREGPTDSNKTPRAKVNRFVDTTSALGSCQECKMKVYPLEKISIHGTIYHKKCFKCMECHTILRMDSYSYNQGLLYCTNHFKRLFITKGNYDTAFGLEQHKEKWNTSMA